MKKKEYRVDKKFDVISMQEFVYKYLETDHSCRNLRHCGLKQFNNPLVIRVANDIAYRHIDLIREREILVVSDSRGDLASYINPNLIKSIFQVKQIEEEIKELEKKHVIGLENLEEFYQNVISRLHLLNKEKDLLEKMYGHNKDIFLFLGGQEKIDQINDSVKENGEIDGLPRIKRKTFCITNETSHD